MVLVAYRCDMPDQHCSNPLLTRGIKERAVVPVMLVVTFLVFLLWALIEGIVWLFRYWLPY